MYNILIIGAGQLGSRHLQGALLSKKKLNITVLDSSNESLRIAEGRANQIELGNKHTKVQYVTRMPKSTRIKICIISTASNIRAEITVSLLESNVVEHIIFEKILFQKIKEYYDISKLIENLNVIAWVNCPRRVSNTYNNISNDLDLINPLTMTVKGSSWGFACNSIHFIDLFSFLVRSTDLILTESHLSNELIESKRSGFFEVTGSINFKIGVNKLIIQCDNEKDLSLSVFIENGPNKYIVNEVQGFWEAINKETVVRHAHNQLLQSQMTGAIIDEIISNNKCGLTSFANSTLIHKPLISELILHMSLVFGKQLDSCPIT